MIQEREKMINIGLWPHQLAGMFQSQQDFWMPLNFFQGGRISGCFVKKSGLTVLNNFYFKGKTKSTSAVMRKYLFCSSSFFNLIWVKVHWGICACRSNVLCKLLPLKQVYDFLESLNEHDEWKPLNDVFKCWRCWFPLPKKWTKTCRNGETLKGRGVGKMYFKTLWILIHDYVCLR